jgi:hypothetical protein
MENDIDTRTLDVFREQAGVITRAQAVALGMSARQIGHRLGKHRWLTIRRGVYRHALFDISPEMEVWALTLSGRGYVSHRYAARLHGLEPELRADPEVTVKAGLHLHVTGVRVHESMQTRTAEICHIQGLPVSGVERTIMDVAALEYRQWWILALIDSARRLNLTDDARLNACLKRHARRGRDGTVNFRRALEVSGLSKTSAIGHLSRETAQLLAAEGLPYPFFEERIHDEQGFVAQVDLSYVLPVVGFLDGFGPHKSRTQMNRDRAQRQRLRNMGLCVFEFTADQVKRSPGYVKRSTVSTFGEAERLVRESPSRYLWWTERRLPRPLPA